MREASDIHHQHLSTLVCDHFICQACGIIDRDPERMRVGHRCPTCSAEERRRRLAFHANISLLVDLMQEVFHSEAPALFHDRSSPQGSDINTVLIFCSLREALLTNFLVENLLAKRVDHELIKRLLADNKSTSQRMEKLFPSVVGAKWEAAVTQLSQTNSVNYEDVSSFIREAASVRNRFIHEGIPWGMTRDLSKRCINSMGKMVSLFVALHNEYTHPVIRGRDAESPLPG
ncbi:MAG: hypothetical protein ACK5QW_04560 [Cyanobacteriota bacterium]